MGSRSTLKNTRPIALVAVALLALAGCGSPGSSGTTTETKAANTSAPKACEIVAGDELTVLTDDLNLQTVDNIIPAVNAQAATKDPSIIASLNVVSASLTTDDLKKMNKSVDVDRKTAAEVARAYVDEIDLKVESTSHPDTITVGAGNFTESEILANIYSLVLQKAGAKTEVQTIGNREIYEPALEKGELTVVPEYLGTLTEFLNKDVNGADAKPLASGDVEQTLGHLKELGAKSNLQFGEPASAADENAFAVTSAFAEKYSVTTLSELAKTCGKIVLGGPPECPERSFCEPGLKDTYGMDISSFMSLDAGGPLTKTALRQGKITLGLVFSSDGTLGQ